MKTTIRTLLMGLMALLAGNALTSCSIDDELQAVPEGQKGYVEFSLSRGAETRTAYALNDANGLNVTWSEGDKVAVAFGKGGDSIVEVFDLVSGAGTKTARFAKEDSDLADKSGALFIEYLPNLTGETDRNSYVLDISNQEGTLDNMWKYDCFAFTATLNDGKIESPVFQPMMSILHFPKDFDFGITATKADLVFSGGVSMIPGAEGDITVKDVSLTDGKLDDDIYVAVYGTGTVPTSLKVSNKTFALPAIAEAGKIYNFAESNLREVDTTPLTLEPVSKDKDVLITINNPLKLTIKYRRVSNDGETPGSFNSDSFIINLWAGEKLQLFGDNAAYATLTSGGYSSTTIQCGDDCYLYGNIMSLISSEEFEIKTKLTETNTFANLFRDNTYIKNHETKALTLPATTLTSSCYAYMFYGCTGLTKAPVLPATKVESGCYRYMFYGCTGLTAAPELPAKEMADDCYEGMFKGCTGLKTAPDLPATQLAESCYSEMFYDCTGLIKGPDNLPASQMAEYSYYEMFYGCSKLTDAPELPAEELAYCCYYLMFAKCSSLTAAPVLPATKMAEYCYYAMFFYCTSLETAPVLRAPSLVDCCYEEMFKGCENLNTVTCLATDISAEYCTYNWLDDVATKGTFTKAACMREDAWRATGIPRGWTVQDYEE